MARRGLSLKAKAADNKYEPFQTDPIGFCAKHLGFHPWPGQNGQKGQKELFQDIGESVRQQLAGEEACIWFKVDAGHGVGKTSGAGALVNWFLTCFVPSIIYTTAPTDKQVKLLLWKEIKRLRRGRGLPGKVAPKDSEIYVSEEHFAQGFTTNDSGGQGTSRAQGQHGEFLMFVLDEAEGVPEFFFESVNAMTTGGRVVIVLMLANPQTRRSAYHRKGKETGVLNYRFSVLDHPNVVMGREVVPHATSRRWAINMIAKHCDPVDEPNDDENTFVVSYSVLKDGIEYPPGQIWKPNAEFCFRVLGIAPANLADKCFVTPGRYEAAVKRPPDEAAGAGHAQIGVDCARDGKDAGTVFLLHKAVCRRTKQIFQGKTPDYLDATKKAAKEAHRNGALTVSFRVDGSGGYGGGLVDALNADTELRELFGDFVVHEVQFGASASDKEKYDNLVTEMYAEAGETLKGISVPNPPNELEGDLTERLYGWVNRSGKTLKALVDKEKFRSKHGRSPDDGDGFVLAVAPEHIFVPKETASTYTYALPAGEDFGLNGNPYDHERY